PADQPPLPLDDNLADDWPPREAEALRGVSGAFQDEPLRNASGTNESRRDRTAMADVGPTGRRPTGTGSGGRLIVTAIRDRGLAEQRCGLHRHGRHRDGRSPRLRAEGGRREGDEAESLS